jgi:type IV secretory pathway VirB10-like protein
MPSLFRYFLVVGSVLTGLLLLVNHWLEPDAAPVKAAVAAPQIITVRHDPRASIIERWRTEQAARKAAERGVPAAPVPAVAAATPEPVPVNEPSPTRPETPQVSAPVALIAAPADGERAAEDARKAEQLKAAQIRKARIARERARAKRQEEAASRQQDQFFYGGPAYAATPASGPFGAGRTW